ncbi:hypothetical protein [Magnetospirillum molischianum]|uniref:Glycoside-hydrolase family GH114 TIM-barrel domain-containing protein n=1 Tax=Magnetospirillum molischianum DSM 120 TaxID=1150626 RepID=H8FUP0_MAGML|nr:hypothetical protein [Magnetospirillum molischianum]CCG42078.1 conserved exported hypothetical protein [Magnetospirillum molischianum DSM 120]
MSRIGFTGIVFLVLALLAPPAQALDKPRDFVPPPPDQVPNVREQTRSVMIELASYAKKRDPNFQVLMRGGVELLIKGDWEVQWEALHDPSSTGFYRRLPERSVFRPLVKVLDGLVLDGLYCGGNALNKPLADAIKERKANDAQIDTEKKLGIQRPPVPVEMGPFSNDPAVELRRAAEIKEKQDREERIRRIVYAADTIRSEGRALLSVDACAGSGQVEAALRGAGRDRVTSFAAVGARLDQPPRPHPPGENAGEVLSVNAIHNWLPLLRSDGFGSKNSFVDAIADSNYDMVVIDVAHRGVDFLVKTDIARMKFKKLGPRRLVLAAMPIGRAYDWRWYWQKGWDIGAPPFLFAHDDKPGTFIADVGNSEWKTMLGKYISGVMDLGFDGVMFDDVDTYLWLEELMPIDR